MEVQTWRDGKTEAIYFKEGVFVNRKVGKQGNEPSGTYVRWQPSEEFFTNTTVEISKVLELFKTITCLCPGLTIELEYNGEKSKFFSKNGLSDLVDESVKDKEIIKNRCHFNFQEDKNKMDFILTYTSNYSSTIIPYVNTGLTEKGPHITQIKTVITREFNKFFREAGWIKKEDKLSGDDIQEGIYILFNLTAPNVSYDAQVKSTITKINMTPFNAALATNLQYWLSANEKDIKAVVDKALNARKAREAARKARDNARNLGKKNKKKMMLNLPTKLVDCWSKDRAACELFIAEGDSAASGLVEGRNAEFHAVFPVRGKIIAAYKHKADKIFANQEVVNLIKAIGLDLDPKTQKLIYDKNKLRYGKILLAADADPDGASIRNLLIELFWWLCPELVEQGHLYTTMPPLFRITTNKNKYIFLKDAAALENYKAQHKGEKFQVNRNKGLGEQDAHELSEALLNPETRNIAQLVVKDKQKTADMIDILLGPSVPPRRAYLLEHEEEANEND